MLPNVFRNLYTARFYSRTFSHLKTTQHWTSDTTVDMAIKLTADGDGSNPPKTIPKVFEQTVKRHPTRPALAHKGKASTWQYWTWQDYWNDSMKFAKSLMSLKVERHKIINIVGYNSPAWFLANNGAIMAGCISSGIYTTNNSEVCLDISKRCQVEVLVLENNIQLSKYVDRLSELTHLKAIVIYDDSFDSHLVEKCLLQNIRVYNFHSFLQLGHTITDDEYYTRQNGILPGHCSSLIFTSGTTGPPKAVMLSHDNVTWCTQVTIDNANRPAFDCNERIISYLPLSHVSAQLVDVHTPMYCGGCTYITNSDALKGTLLQTLVEIKPTIFFGVPRVWEKIEERIKDIGRSTSGLKKVISSWAKSVAMEKNNNLQYKHPDDYQGKIPFTFPLADALVLSKVKTALGLDKAKCCYSGAAPISPDTLKFFGSLDIKIFEGYGLSETAGTYSIGAHHGWKIGTVGRPFPGTFSKIDAETGELQIKSRSVFMGYMHMPQETEASFTEDGYFRTGDIAHLDKDDDIRVPLPSGFVTISGRLKDLIITAGGENVPPLIIENTVKNELQAVSNCILIGDRRKFLTILLTLKCVTDVDNHNAPTDNLAPVCLSISKDIGSSATKVSEAVVDPRWIDYINRGIAKANDQAISNAQRIQKWRILPVDISEAQGDLTPTQKLKRNVVINKYLTIIEEMYE